MKKLMCIALIACSCQPQLMRDEVYNNVPLRSYVMKYFNTKELYVVGGFKQEDAIEVIALPGTVVGNYKSTGAEKLAYDALCEKHNDMMFNRTVTFYSWGDGNYFPTYPGADFTSVEVVSNTDYGDDYPAGSPLDGLITARYCSLKPYIESGYAVPEGEDIDELTNLPANLTWFEKKLSEITATDLVLAGRYYEQLPYHDRRISVVPGLHLFTLIFDRPPTLSKVHMFTVTMTADNGRVFSDTIEMRFE